MQRESACDVTADGCLYRGTKAGGVLPDKVARPEMCEGAVVCCLVVCGAGRERIVRGAIPELVLVGLWWSGRGQMAISSLLGKKVRGLDRGMRLDSKVRARSLEQLTKEDGR